MIDRPLVSVIVPTYNRATYLPEAVECVLAQTYEPWELIVVDDGSTDGTHDYLAGLTDPRIRSIMGTHSGNRAAPCNIGARAARGAYLAFLDSDDLWLPQKLALQMDDLLKHPECRWSYTGRVCVDPQGREVHGGGIRPWAPYRGWILEHLLTLRALVASSAALIERRLYESVGGFDESLARCEDVDMWIKLAEASPAGVVPTVLVQKRLHPEDRGTEPLDVQDYMNRIYGGLLERTNSPAVRRLCRRLRTRVNLDIVGGCRSAGRYAEARQALAVAFPLTGWTPGWWISALKTLVRPAIPRPLLAIVARRRTRAEPSKAVSERGQVSA